MPTPVLAAATLALFVFAGAASAQETSPPAPKAVIYPGDVIGSDMLVDATLDGSRFDGPFALARSDVIGKMSRRTLLPGRPIPLRALDNPRAIRNGAEVRLLYVDGDLTIVAAGVAMQDASAGDIVKIRNSDSGVTVSGVAQADGTVRVNGG